MSHCKPNFLFILTDQQQRKGLGCYGNDIARTPNIDRLAQEGVIFDNAFTANVICMPSRASILTGRMPRAHGLVTNGNYLDPLEITLPQVLAEQGYRTSHVGKCHLAPHAESYPGCSKSDCGYESPEGKEFWAAGKKVPLPYYGFQQAKFASGHGKDHTDYYNEIKARDPRLPELLKSENALKPLSGAPSSWKSAIPEQHHCSTWVADNAISNMEEFARGDNPFFMFVGFPDPHVPYCPPAPWCDMFDPQSVPMPNRSRVELETASKTYARRIKEFAEVWPYHPLDMPDEHIREIIAHTYGMVSLVDKNIGRIMDTLKRLNLDENTIVIFSTDHGEHLGDHWLVYKMCIYDELIRLPLIWSCPGRLASGKRIEGIVSHIDIMPTILDLAGSNHPRGVQGISYAEGLGDGQIEGRPYAYLEDDAIWHEGNNTYLRTIRTPEYRLSYYFPEGDGELFDLKNDPNEFINRWHEPAYHSVRTELMELLLQAAMQAADPKPQIIAPC